MPAKRTLVGVARPRARSPHPRPRSSYPDLGPKGNPVETEAWPSDRAVYLADVDPSLWPAWTDAVAFTTSGASRNGGAA